MRFTLVRVTFHPEADPASVTGFRNSREKASSIIGTVKGGPADFLVENITVVASLVLGISVSNEGVSDSRPLSVGVENLFSSFVVVESLVSTNFKEVVDVLRSEVSLGASHNAL